MLQLVTAALFVGYTLVYAAVANGGKLAESPWRALREDAYTGDPVGAIATSRADSGQKHSGILGKVAGTGVDLLLGGPLRVAYKSIPGLGWLP